MRAVSAAVRPFRSSPSRLAAALLLTALGAVTGAAPANATPLFTAVYDTPAGWEDTTPVIGMLPTNVDPFINPDFGPQPEPWFLAITTNRIHRSPAYDGDLDFSDGPIVPFTATGLITNLNGCVAFNPATPRDFYVTGGTFSPRLFGVRTTPATFTSISVQGSGVPPTGCAYSDALGTVVLSGRHGVPSFTPAIWAIDLTTGAPGPLIGTSGPGTLTSPGALAIGPDDRIYVIDTTMDGTRIVGFDTDGTYHHEFPLVGTAVVSALEISPDGRLYTANGNGGGDVYDLADGEHLGTYESSGVYPYAGKAVLRFDPAGYLYLFDPATGFHVFNPPMDTDADGIDDDVDNCPIDANADQLNADALLAGGDALGDACDSDDDADGAADVEDVCAGYDDFEDVDADLVPDGCDPCINAGAQALSVGPLLGIKKIGADETDGNESLSLKGSFVLPSTFASLDLAADGIRVIILAQDGSTVTDVTVPGGERWSATNAKKFQFSDPSGAHNGIIKFQLTDQNAKAPNQAAIKLTAKNGSYPVEAGDEPLQVIVVVGDSSLGECTETEFIIGDCELNGSETSIKCQ